jgi:putative oxidoreductase
MFEAESERIPNRVGVLTAWLLRIAVAVAFIGFGVGKFRDPFWVRFFARVGVGQWFRYVTGIIEIGGGVLVVVPGLTLVGLALLACTMAGAAIVWLAFGEPGNAAIPAIVLGMRVAIGWSEYTRASENGS